MSRIGKRGSDAPDMSLEEKVRLCRSVEMPAEEIAERTGSTVERVLSIIGDDLSIADLKIKITIMIKKRRIDRAIEILQEYIDKHPELKGLRLSMLPYKDQGWMVNVPLYAVSF